jgi:hypothetical protein
MSIEADLTGHPAMASLSSPRSGCLRARGRCPASSAPRTPGPPRARGVNQLTGLSNQHTRMGKLCLAIVCFWQLLVALRRSNQPVVLSWLLSPRVLIGNKTGFWSVRGATSLVPFPPRRRSCRGRRVGGFKAFVSVPRRDLRLNPRVYSSRNILPDVQGPKCSRPAEPAAWHLLHAPQERSTTEVFR